MKNKNLVLAGALASVLTFPAMAATGIGANAQSADCDNGVLGTYTGPAALSANWTANTIKLDFYDGDDKISSGQCTYDAGITLPNDPTKTGYEFAGWKVRRAAAPVPSGPNCSEITNDSTCNATNGCVYNYGSDNITYWYTPVQGCAREVFIESLSYNSCSEITDQETCMGVTSTDNYYGDDHTRYTVCLWQDGKCRLGFYSNGEAHRNMPESWCTEISQIARYRSDCSYYNGLCYCVD